MAENFFRTTLRVDQPTAKIISERAANTNKDFAEVARELIKKGLASEWIDENTDLITRIIRQQLEIVLKPHIERLAKISSKSGHMSATAAFLNVQALMDLVPKEQRKDVRIMYESARKKAVTYMKTKTDEFNENIYQDE